MEFNCQSCNGTIDAAPESEGQASTCPHCKVELVIPKRNAPTPVAPPGSAPPPVAPPETLAPTPPPEPEPELLRSAPAPRANTVAPAPQVAAPYRQPMRPGIGQVYNPNAKSGPSVVYIIIGVLAVALVVAMFMLAQNRKDVAERSKPKPEPAKVVERTGMEELTADLTAGNLILQAMHSFSKSNGGLFPQTLDDLTAKYLHRDDLLCIADVEKNKKARFEYYKGYNISSEEGILLSSPKPVKGKRAVIRVDGSAEVIPEKMFQAELNPGVEIEDGEEVEMNETTPESLKGEEGWEDA